MIFTFGQMILMGLIGLGSGYLISFNRIKYLENEINRKNNIMMNLHDKLTKILNKKGYPFGLFAIISEIKTYFN